MKRTNYICSYVDNGHSYIFWACISFFECMGFDQVDETKSQDKRLFMVFHDKLFIIPLSFIFKSQKHRIFIGYEKNSKRGSKNTE